MQHVKADLLVAYRFDLLHAVLTEDDVWGCSLLTGTPERLIERQALFDMVHDRYNYESVRICGSRQTNILGLGRINKHNNN